MNGRIPIIGQQQQEEIRARMVGQMEQQAMAQSLLFSTVGQLYIQHIVKGMGDIAAINKAVDQGHVMMKRLGIPLKVAAPPLEESSEGAEPDSRYTKQ